MPQAPKIPIKPFDDFKWRWLSANPTEGLLEPPVLLGVVRAVGQHNGVMASDENLSRSLKKVQEDTGTKVNLQRTQSRNLFRNSGQYWKETGLIKNQSGPIYLTQLGKQVADGELTQTELASVIIQQTVLPNRIIFSEEHYKKWDSAGLSVRPLLLILQIMVMMGDRQGKEEAYLTPNELASIIVPLSGDNATLEEYLSYLLSHRKGPLDLTDWPNCTPDTNDFRMICEFFHFLENFGVCAKEEAKDRGESKYYLSELPEIGEMLEFDSTAKGTEQEIFGDAAISSVLSSALPKIIERQKVSALINRRMHQAPFRREVLNACACSCVVSGTSVEAALDAAHIIPVSHGGLDEAANGLCLRADLHRLYDGGLMKIEADGSIILSNRVRESIGYSDLAPEIKIPDHVHKPYIEWRNRYC